MTRSEIFNEISRLQKEIYSLNKENYKLGHNVTMLNTILNNSKDAIDDFTEANDKLSNNIINGSSADKGKVSDSISIINDAVNDTNNLITKINNKISSNNNTITYDRNRIEQLKYEYYNAES